MDNKNVNEQVEPTVANSNVVVVELKKPIELDGKNIAEIRLDFSTLTGEDVLKIDTELRQEGHPMGFDNIWNQKVLLKLAARAAKMLPEDLRKLSAGDFLEVQFNTRNFFVQW